MRSIFFDAYDRRARLSPALLAALPLAVSIVPLAQELSAWWTVTAPLLAYCGGTYLLAQLARDRGKRIEPRLFRRWGGPPATRLLRHRGARNPVAVARRHAQLARVVPDLHLPSLAEEAADPLGADQVYEVAVDYLRDATRDDEKFPLVFKEICNYGFRRNLYGLRSYGAVAAVLGVAASVPTSAFGPLALNLLALLLWFSVVTPTWVRVAADAYAERLLATPDHLPSIS